MVAPLSNAGDVCGTFTLVTPLLPFQFILRNICLVVDSIMANIYSTFCPTQANDPVLYIQRIDDSWFSTTLLLLLSWSQRKKRIYSLAWQKSVSSIPITGFTLILADSYQLNAYRIRMFLRNITPARVFQRLISCCARANKIKSTATSINFNRTSFQFQTTKHVCTVCQ